MPYTLTDLWRFTILQLKLIALQKSLSNKMSLYVPLKNRVHYFA